MFFFYFMRSIVKQEAYRGSISLHSIIVKEILVEIFMFHKKKDTFLLQTTNFKG